MRESVRAREVRKGELHSHPFHVDFEYEHICFA